MRSVHAAAADLGALAPAHPALLGRGTAVSLTPDLRRGGRVTVCAGGGGGVGTRPRYREGGGGSHKRYGTVHWSYNDIIANQPPHK